MEGEKISADVFDPPKLITASMDIRKFFGAPGAVKKTESSSSKKPSDTDHGSLTKLKSDRSKGNDTKNSNAKKKDSSELHSDVNGNKHKKESHGGVKKSDKDEHAKHKKQKKKTEEKAKSDIEDEIVLIDDDSVQETFEEKKRKGSKSKNDSKNKNDSKSKNDKKTPKKESEKPERGKKRKKQISSDSEEEEVHISNDDSEDDDDVVTGKRSKPKKKDKKKAKRILDSDSDEEPIPKKAKRQKKDRPVLHIGGTGEEEVEEKRKKMTFMDKFLTSPSPQKQKPKSESVKKEPKQTVNASDFFGSSPVHRSEKKVAMPTKPGSESKAAEDIEDIEMHSDDDFEKTLEMLDDDSMTIVKQKPVKPEPESAESKESPSLSSKLAEKIKQKTSSPQKKGAVFVADTPEPKRTSPKKPSPKRAKMEFVPSRADKKSPNKPSPSKTDEKSTPAREKKISPVKSDSETPKHKGVGYRSYLNREGPQALGSKEIPEGADNCLEGLTFVITGVLESFERDESKSMVERYGGKVTTTVSKRTDYLVLGREPGQSKIAKAESFKTKQIDEDELLELIRTRPGKKSKYVVNAEESVKKEKSIEKQSSLTKKLSTEESAPTGLKKGFSSSQHSQSEESKTKNDQSEESKIQTNQSESMMWVDKYKPTNLKQIIGQTGEKSNAKKLLHWLTNWHKSQAAGIKPATGNFFGRGGSDDGAGFKAALLSGPPGVGKTTTVTLVCQEAGFSFVELNASDTRNAKSLKEVVSQAVGNTSMVDFLGSGESVTGGRKHCLVMDEVDGMSGNNDRGGIQELVNIIKKTRVPIITMCNDRSHPKIRTLSNHCFDLRFQRPRVEQIKGAMMSLAFKEGLKIPPPAMNEIILAANQDIRQIVHNLSMFSSANKSVTYDQAKADAQQAKKDVVMGPFDVCRKVFVGGEETRKMTITDKSDLFFHDYNIAPLFVQENYIHVTPFAAKGKMSRHLSLLARAADSICVGDCTEKRIRTSQNWSLLAMEAMTASVIPGEYMRGSVTQMITFPSWLGKNSTTGKTERIMQELRTHMRLQISGDKRSLNLDYLPYMRGTLTQPLVQKEAEGVRDVIRIMDDYDIVKDDFDNIMEITKWPNSSDPFAKLSTQTKAAFTRTYNKESHMTPYSTGQLSKKKRGGGGGGGDDLDLMQEGEGEELAAVEEEEEDKEDLELDSMIKKKAAKKTTKTESKGKGKGPAKGPAKGKGAAKGKKK